MFNFKQKIILKLIMLANNNQIIIDLQNKLKEANRIIEDQKLTITSLQNKLKEYELIEKRLTSSNNQLRNLIEKNKDLVFQDKNCYCQDLFYINFISNEQNIHHTLKCTPNQIFAEVEEKLYQEYPEYRNTDNVYLSNGNKILRFKTIAENKLKNGDTVILIGQNE